jgi:lantibiotic modifying enzyme
MLLKGGSRQKTLSNRLAWCYGDITQAILFQTAGRVLQERHWLELAQQIGSTCVLRRSQAQTMVQDASFCHGAAGLTQLYLSLYQATKDPVYQTEHQYWLCETLRLLEADLTRHHYQGIEWSLLDGLPGIGLVLLSSLFPSAASWTTLLLID